MITYAVEDYLKVEPELKAIYPEHYEELTVSKNFPLAPNYERYAALAKSGILKLITCRNKNELIGYVIMMVAPALHYKTCIVAHEDIYYLKKEYRKGRVGIKLFKFVEDEMKKIGVDRVVMGTKVYSDNSKLFEYLGYRFYEKLYTKEI
jgi:hypothetical protein